MKPYLMMSIKTKHANKIFNGSKTFEYRTKSIGENNLNKFYSTDKQKQYKVVGLEVQIYENIQYYCIT